MSILVTTTNTGTDRARAKPKCSFVMPTMPAFAPICETIFFIYFSMVVILKGGSQIDYIFFVCLLHFYI